MESDKQADRAERDVEEMEERSERLGDHIEETKRDWEQKKSDERVPGAQPDAEEEDAEQ
jgi:hypothetical protein